MDRAKVANWPKARNRLPRATYTVNMLPLAFELPAFLLGLLLGSFLNVCISRLPAQQSVIRPRSRCGQCGAAIAWYDNVPIVSWLLLRARCRACQQPISWRYPMVELSFGLWMALAAHGERLLLQTSLPTDTIVERSLDGLGFALLGFLLIGLMVIDWQTHTLPDAFTLTGMVLGFVLICIRSSFLGPHEDEVLLHGRNPLSSPGNVVDRGNVVLTGSEHLVLGRLLAIAAAAGILLLVRFLYQRVRGREGIGLGDAKLMGMLAAFVGFGPAVLALFVGVVLCSGYALGLLARRQATAATRLPLGSFLAFGGLVTAVAGEALLTWYKGML